MLSLLFSMLLMMLVSFPSVVVVRAAPTGSPRYRSVQRAARLAFQPSTSSTSSTSSSSSSSSTPSFLSSSPRQQLQQQQLLPPFRRNQHTTTNIPSPRRSSSDHNSSIKLWWKRSRRRRNVSSSADDDGNDDASSSSSSSSVLEWDKFEFGDSPKWDARFDDSGTLDANDANNNNIKSNADLMQTGIGKNPEKLNALRRQEAAADDAMTKQMQRRAAAWDALDAALVSRAVTILAPHVTYRRRQRLEHALTHRTRHVRFLFENPANPSNVWACLRTLDAFGIQHVDVVVDSDQYGHAVNAGPAALAQKRGTRVAMGSAQWLTVHPYASTRDALQSLRTQGYRIWASHLGGDGNGDGNGDGDNGDNEAHDIRDIDWDADPDDRPICIVMGNEERGISDEMLRGADATFYLPMVGFAESFNLSVATAITLAHLSAASSSSSDGRRRGPLRPGDLPPHEYNCLLLKGMLNSVSQTRAAYALLRREGIDLPDYLHRV